MTLVRERSDKRVTEESDLGVSQDHHYYWSSAKDSVITEKFRGKDGEDVDRFLRVVQRLMDRNLEIGK